ncbi:MAG: trypsin-like peptidase domain-containing protein [Acidobacteria bacterium]|nr:trypsin-like peptidase domain-containing protein [Acidobacteriota bacterium]
MTESPPPAFSWLCPECGRRVPASVTTCRCGAVREASPPAAQEPVATPAPESTQAPTPARSSPAGVVVGAVVVLAAVAAAWYRLTSSPVPTHSAAAAPTRTASTTRAGAPPLTALPPTEAPTPLAADAPPPDAEPAAEPPAPPLEDLVARVTQAVIIIQTPTGRGSGFFIAPDTILTNVHVVGAESTVTIRRTDGTTTTARVDATAPAYDIAILKVFGFRADQAIISMGSAASGRVGQEVIAIGTPLGFLQNTVSRGIVSGLRDVNGVTLVQTDAAINPGNSGGPLLDRHGVALGIVNSGYAGRDGLSFAIAIDHARALLERRLAPPSTGAAPSAFAPLAPSVPSQTDQRRAGAERAYQQALDGLARRATDLDDRWRSFKVGCYSGSVAHLDREWFGFWDPKALPGAVAPQCESLWGDLRRAAQGIRDDVMAANEAARRADVLPGTRRDLLRRYKLDYAGWER